MMRSIPTAILLMLPVAAQSATALDLEYVRKNYEQAAGNKSSCQKLIEGLAANIASDVHLAYLGALQTIWAKHVSGPVAKLKTFNKGKQNLEAAVKADPHNVEIRFLRLSVQQHAPSFLDYDDDIKADKAFVLKYRDTVSSPVLQQLINKVL